MPRLLKRKPTIIFVIRDILATGGAQLNALRLARQLQARGHGIIVLGQGEAPDIRKHLGAYGIHADFQILTVTSPRGGLGRVLSFFPNIYFWMPAFVVLLRHRHRYDIVHGPLLMDSCIICALATFLLGKPSVVKIGSAGEFGDVSRFRQNRLRGLLRLCLRKITRFVCLTGEISREVSEGLKVEEKKIIRIPNGVDVLTQIPVTAMERSEFLEKMGFGAYEKIVLFVGRLEKKKRVSMLIEAWRQVCAKCDCAKAHLIIAGDGSLRPDLERDCHGYGLSNAVTFFGETSDVGSLMRISDIFVLPSVSEGMANVFLEAMAHGLPIVATRSAASMELFEHHADAMLFESDSVDQLADQIRFLLKNKEACHELGAAARKKVETRYNLGDIAEQYSALYRSMGKH
jgi:glycosyltransferase involved in cell wall biosynthesis